MSGLHPDGGTFPQVGQMLVGTPGYGSIPAERQTTRRRNKEPRAKTLPSVLDGSGPGMNDAYTAAMENPADWVSPEDLGMVPTGYCGGGALPFGEMVRKFFQRKNNASCRFPHKLYNALQIVLANPSDFPLVGVKWVTDSVFLVDKYVFGRLLGITSFDGGLFHRQGNFRSHGFVELTADEAASLNAPGYASWNLDYDRVRVLTHTSGLFVKGCNEEFFATCKWGDGA